VLLRLLKPLFELSHLFGQMAYLIGIPTAWFLPGLLRGIEGLSQPVLLAAVLVEPTTLFGVVSRERSVNSLAPFAKLVGTALLGVPFVGPIWRLQLPWPYWLGLLHLTFQRTLSRDSRGPTVWPSETRELSCESGYTDSSTQLVGGSV
jgi:hypothetical protein